MSEVEYYAEYSTCGCSFIASTLAGVPQKCPIHTHPMMKLKCERVSLYAGLEKGLAGGYCDCSECVANNRMRG